MENQITPRTPTEEVAIHMAEDARCVATDLSPIIRTLCANKPKRKGKPDRTPAKLVAASVLMETAQKLIYEAATILDEFGDGK